MTLQVGTQVRINVGMWLGFIGTITEVIKSDDTDDRYDVSCVPGRWYYPHELEIVIDAEVSA